MIPGLLLGALAFVLAAVVASLGVPFGGAAVAFLGLVAFVFGVVRARASKERAALGSTVLFSVAGLLLGSALGGGMARAASAAAAAKARADEAAAQQLLARVPEASAKLDAAERLILVKDLDGAAAQLREGTPLLQALGALRGRAPEIPPLETRATKLAASLASEREAFIVAQANALVARQGASLRSLLDSIADLERLSGASAEALQAKVALVAHVKERVGAFGVLRRDFDVFEAKQLGHPARVPKGATEMALSQFLPHARATASFEKGVCSGLYLVAADRTVGLEPSLASSFVELAIGPGATPRAWPRPPKPTQSVTRTHGGVPVTEGWADGKLVELSIGQVAL